MTKQTMVKTKEHITENKANIPDESARQQKCHHFWHVESAAGPISRGVCQICGMKRDFDNYLSDCLKGNSKSI